MVSHNLIGDAAVAKSIFYIQSMHLTQKDTEISRVPLTMSLKAFSMAPITRLSCDTFFSVKKRVGGVLGEPGAPAAPRSDAALVRTRWDEGVRWWLIGSSFRHVGGTRSGVQRMSMTSWRCRAMWWWRRREAITAAPEPACPSNNAQ